MKPLQPAAAKPGDKENLIRELLSKWIDGNEVVRKCFPGVDYDKARESIHAFVGDEMEDVLWMNDVYQVATRERQPGCIHLSIKRLDRQPIHDWRDLQEIKNQLVGPECEGLELYPAESRRVDSANQYHIWCVKDPKYRFPFGFNDRLVTEDSLANSVNRPFA